MTRPPEGGDRLETFSLEDDLAFLLLFADATLELIPDGVVVLDAGLRIRSSNTAGARLLGFTDPGAAAGADLSGHALLALRPGGAGESLRDALAALGSEELGNEEEARPAGLDVELSDHEGNAWRVRASFWDAEHPDYRRIVLWLRRLEPAPAGPRPSVREEQADLLFRMTARNERLLDRLPLGVCVVDSGLRVLTANRHLQEALGRPFHPDAPGDRHLFAVFPELRDEEFRERLKQCHETADSVRGTLTAEGRDGALLEVEVEVVAVESPDRHLGELILLFHEVRGMPPASTPSASATATTPTRAEEILREDHLARWVARNRRILVVERDSWGRMLLSDALRQAGQDDVTFAESSAEALRLHDPAAFGLVIAGFDGDAQEAAELCRRVAEIDPRVPVLCVAQRPEARAGEALAGLPVLGILTPPDPRELAAVIAAIFHEEDSPAADTEPAATPERDEEEREYDVVVLGASDNDVPVLRLLYRVQRMRIRLVYDPDPEAFGLSLAQNLGIAAVSGELTMALERPPDFVVLARDGLDDRLAPLGLDRVPCVTRDEVELFLVDPDSFLPGASPVQPGRPEAVEPPASAPDVPDFEPPASAPDVPDFEPPAPAPDVPDFEPPPPAPDAFDFEPPAPGPPEAPRAEEPPRTLGAMAVDRLPAAPPAVTHVLSQDVESILGALDLLLDFDRFAERILSIAIELAGGASGSLMIVREDERELRIVAARGLSDLIVQRTRQRIGDGVAGRVAGTGEPRLLEGRMREKVVRDWDRPDVHSAVCVPVLADERVIGVLSVNSDPAGRPFDGDVLRDVAALGRKVGTALDRSIHLRSMRGRSFELSVRGEIERITANADDLASCLRTVTSRIVDMMSVDTCAIWLIDPKGGELALRAIGGADVPGMGAMSIPVGSGLVGWVARMLKPMILRNWGDGVLDIDDSIAAVAVPIRHRTDLVGVLHVESTTGRMDEDRLDILTSVASVIGRQVGGLQAHESSERKVTMLSALSELGLAFGAVPEREGLSRLVTFTACTLLGSDVATMRVLRPGKRSSSPGAEDYELLAAHGGSLGEPGDPLTDLDACLAQEVVETRQPCRDSEVASSTVRPLLERSNVRSALAMPLTSGDGDLVAILTVFRAVDARSGSQAFRDEDVEIAARLADYAAAAMQRFVEPPRRRDEGGDDPRTGQP